MNARSRIAIVSSLALHGVALLLVSHAEPHSRPPAPPPEPIPFQLLVRERPKELLVPSTPPLPEKHHLQVRSAPPPQEVAVPPRPEPLPTPVAPEVVPPSPRPPSSAPKVDLFPHDALSHAAEGVVIPQEKHELARLPGEAAGERAATEAERVTERIAAASIDTDARTRVQAGIVDPSYSRMGRAFLDAWNPDRALPETSAELWIKRRAQNAIVSARLWQEAGANYARTGSAVAPGETLEKTTDVRPEAALGLGTDGRKQNATFRQYMSGTFNSGRSAHVLVEEDLKQVRVSLVQTSGDVDLDRAALEDIRAALTRMRAEHPEEKRRRTSVWMMRLLILINPPVPVVGVSFDEVIQKPHLELPLDRHLFKHVELEAVYDDARPAPGADAGPR